jgi:DNA-binding SARP family transcriptional activator
LVSLNRVRLFGRFEVSASSSRTPPCLEARKVQELFCYLLLSQHRPVQRERVADDLWPGVDPVRSKKYLRQALWQLQKATAMLEGSGPRMLVVNQEWIGTAPDANLSVDVAEFAEAYEQSIRATREGSGPAALSPALRENLQRAVELYRADLLEGWYCDWAVQHQDVYRSMLLLMLDRLVTDTELSGDWELGLTYGRRALQMDPANERIHVGMMRLHCGAGNRTAALRQFDTCAQALREELDVEPEQGTRDLYALIRSEGYKGWHDMYVPVATGRPARTSGRHGALALGWLRDLNRSLGELQEQIAGQIRALEGK